MREHVGEKYIPHFRNAMEVRIGIHVSIYYITSMALNLNHESNSNSHRCRNFCNSELFKEVDGASVRVHQVTYINIFR